MGKLVGKTTIYSTLLIKEGTVVNRTFPVLSVNEGSLKITYTVPLKLIFQDSVLQRQTIT